MNDLPKQANGHEISSFRDTLRQSLGVERDNDEEFGRFLSYFSLAWYAHRNVSWGAIEAEVRRLWSEKVLACGADISAQEL